MKITAMFLLLTFALANLAWATPITIGPFGVKETAVKGDIRRQLNELVKQVLAEAKTVGPEQKIKMTVIGSADQTGPEADNDTYSKDRALSIKGYLEASLSNAEVVIVPAGSELNARIATVSYEFVATPTVNTQSTSPILFVGIALVFIMTAMLVLRSKKNKPVVIVEEKHFGPPVEFNAGGLRYRCLPEVDRNGKFVSLRPTIDREGKTFYPAYDESKAFKDSSQSYFKELHAKQSNQKTPTEIQALIDRETAKILGPAEERRRENEKISNTNPVPASASGHWVVGKAN